MCRGPNRTMDSSSSWVTLQIEALTVIDTVTNLVELVRIEKKNSDHITQTFGQCWLTRYPWSQGCIYDPGGEFTGPKFQTL
jgi:hypothetical protein